MAGTARGEVIQILMIAVPGSYGDTGIDGGAIVTHLADLVHAMGPFQRETQVCIAVTGTALGNGAGMTLQLHRGHVVVGIGITVRQDAMGGKARYRGLDKNANRLFVACGLVNLYMARRQLLQAM